MKVKTLINCIGIGYDLKKGDETELNNKLAKLLLRFKYVEEVKTSKKAVK